MPCPPDPGLPALLLAVAARLGWRALLQEPSGLELGELFDGDRPKHLIVVAGPTPNAMEWALVGEVPRGFAAHLMTNATYDALHACTIGPLRMLWSSGTDVDELDIKSAV
jgi:hypothetical protein